MNSPTFPEIEKLYFLEEFIFNRWKRNKKIFCILYFLKNIIADDAVPKGLRDMYSLATYVMISWFNKNVPTFGFFVISL